MRERNIKPVSPDQQVEDFQQQIADGVMANELMAQTKAKEITESPFAKKVAKTQKSIIENSTAVLAGLTTGVKGADPTTQAGKTQITTAALTPIDQGFELLEKTTSTLFRKYLGPRLTAAFLVSSPAYREQNKELIDPDTNGASFESRQALLLPQFLTDENKLITKAREDGFLAVNPVLVPTGRMVLDERGNLVPELAGDDPNDIWSPKVWSTGRSSFLGLAGMVPGKQGVELLDFEDREAVDEYFRQGIPKFVSGMIDFAANGLDPAWWGPAKAKKAYTALVMRPVTKNNLPILKTEIDAAAETTESINSWSYVLDKIEEVAKPENFSVGALDNIGLLKNNSGANATRVLLDAQILGGRPLAAEVLKVIIDPTSAEGVEKMSATLGAQLRTLYQKEEILNNYITDLLNPNTITPPMGSVEGMRKYAINAPRIGDDLEQGQKNLASYLQNEELEKLRSEIAAKSDMAKLYFDMTTVDGRSLNQTVPITALKKLMEKQIISAQRADDSFWTFDPIWSPNRYNPSNASRVGYWVNPSGMLKETASGMANFSGPAANRAYREIAARIRDLARITGMSADEGRKLFSGFRMLATKSEQFGYADELLNKAHLDITAKYVPSAANLTPEQQKVFNKIFEVMNLETKKARGQVIQEASKNYTIMVDGKRTKIPQLESLINDLAADYIVDNKLNISLEQARKIVTDDLIRGTATTTSQVPSIHFAPRATDIHDFVISHKAELQNLVDNIIDGSLNLNNVTDVLEAPKDYLNKLDIAGMSGTRVVAGGEKTLARDNLARFALSYQNSIWKPFSLIGFQYTTRNVFEGLTRVAMLFGEFHQERGYKFTDMFADLAGANNRLVNHSINKAQAKQWRANLKAFEDKFDDLTKDMTKQQKAAEDIFLNAQDGVTLSMKDFQNAIEIVSDFKASSKASSSYMNAIVKSAKLTFNEGRGKNLSEDFINSILGGDYKRAWELSVSMSPVQLSNNLKYIQEQALGTLRQISFLLDKGEKAGNLGYGVRKATQGLLISLSHISASTDAAYLGLLNRANARGELEKILAEVSFKKPTKLRSGEGLFEPVKGSGYLMNDAFADEAGKLMRGLVSSAASTSSTILNVRQQIAKTRFNYYAKEELIFPFEFVGSNVTNKANSQWAEAFTDYMNNIYYNDALAQKILSFTKVDGEKELKAQLEKWLKSKESVAWRRDLEYQVSKYPSRSDGKSKYVWIIEERMAEINKVLPLRGANGEDLSKLRQKVLNRNFTNKDSLSIPEIDRMPVNGVTIAKHKSELFPGYRTYKSLINSIFNFLGTVPEDTFVRFPFYRTVYRNEVRRRVNLIKSQGKNPENFEKQIANAAREEAYKQVMERLYSIERYTDLGQVMQFASPFYMSKQNSSRFWVGAAAKNPANAVLALKIWNIPNAMGVVYDEYGNRVAYDTPWTTEDNQVIVGLPEPVAKLYGSKVWSFSKSQIDVMFQGQTPVIPSFGGPVVDATVVNFMPFVTGKPWDPDLVAKRLGYGPNFIQEKLLPFYQSVKDNPNENQIITTARAMIGLGSQWKPLMAAAGAIMGNPGNVFMAKQDTLYRSEVMEYELRNEPMSPKDHKRALDRAWGNAVSSLITEGLVASLPGIVKPKLTTLQQLERKKIDKYISLYGYEEGILRYQVDTNDPDSAVYLSVLASASIATDNIFGLFSTSETVRNLEQNKDIVAEVDALNANSSVVGYFLNEGSPSEDWSVTAEEHLYNTKVNNKNIKSKNISTDQFIYETQKRSFNNEYYGYVSYIDIMRKADAQAGREESASYYDELKSEERKRLEKKYAVYTNDPTYKSPKSVTNDLRTMYAMTQDEKFMKTVGLKNQYVILAVDYLYNFRPKQVQDKLNGTKTTKELDAKRVQYIEDISGGNADLNKFMQIFFSRDNYEPIDINDVWEPINE